jgi:branched-chain amino acid transport system permease protein
MSADATQRTAKGAALLAAPGFASLARRSWPWLAAIVTALVLPWLFFDWSTHRHSGFALTMLS